MNVPVLAPSGVAPEFESGPVHFIAAAGGSLLSDCRGYQDHDIKINALVREHRCRFSRGRAR